MRKRGYCKKILAIMLSVSMLSSSFQSLAAPVTETHVAAQGVVDGTANVEEVPYNEPLSTEIVSEVEDLREANVKYFRMKDGTYTAVTYNTPVHYEDEDGTFREIDNTLVPVAGSNNTVYQNKAGLYQVELPATLDGDTPIELTFGEHRLSWIFSDIEAKQPGLIKNPLAEEVWVGDFSLDVEIPSVEIQQEMEVPESIAVEEETQAEVAETETSVVEEMEPETDGVEETLPTDITEETLEGTIKETTEETTVETVEIVEEQPTTAEIKMEEAALETVAEAAVEQPVASTPSAKTKVVYTPALEDLEITPLPETMTPPTLIEVEGFTTIETAYTLDDLSEEDQAGILGEEKLQVEKTNAVMVYAGRGDVPQIAYQLSSNRVKESIILGRAPENEAVYRFRFATNGLVGTLREDASVMFTDPETKEEIFLIQSPYMMDDEGLVSAAIEVTLTETEDGYEYTMTPDQEWLNDEERTFPVVIDPTVITVQGALVLHDTTAAYKNRTTTLANRLEGSSVMTIKMGKMSSTEVAGLVYIPMPTSIPDAARVINAQMYLCGYRDKYQNCAVDETIAAYAITSDWDQDNFNINKILYNNSTPTIPTNETRAQDYKILNDTDRYGIHKQPFYFDITEAAGRWASGELQNRGIIYRHIGNTAAERYMQFYSCNVSACAPALIIQYRDTKGVEDYWTYTTMEAGRGGTLAVNNFNGNVTFIQPLPSVTGERMPVSLSLLYDSTRRYTGGEGFGSAWRTNYHMQVKTSTLTGYPYYLVDADGTEHYFFLDEGIYKDEDGLEYTLTLNPESGVSYRITDKEKTKMDFDSAGRLIKVTDELGTNSNRVTYTSGNLISTITDGAGKVYTFQYQSGTDLVSKITDPAGRETTFTYSNGWMIAMNFAGKTINFAISSGGIERITAPDGSYTTVTGHIAYDHFFGTNLKWYGSDGQLYQHYVLDYGTNTTRLTSPIDAGIDLTYQFNHFGQTVNVQDNITGLGESYQYGAPGGTNGDANKITSVSKTLAATKNLVSGGSFHGGNTSFTESVSASGIGSVSYDGMKGHFEGGSLKVTKTGSSGTVSGTQTVTLPKTGAYTLSAYFFTNGAGAYMGDSVGMTATVAHADGTTSTYKSAPLRKLGDSDWARLPLTFEGSVGETVTLSIGFCHNNQATGTVWVDDIQLETGGGATSVNLLKNPDFANGMTEWKGTATAITVTDHPYIAQGVRAVGNQVYSNAHQDVYLSGKQGDVFVAGVWTKGASIAVTAAAAANKARKPNYCLCIEFYQGETMLGGRLVPFNDACQDWQFLSAEAIAPGDYDMVRIICAFDHNLNTADFAQAFLYKETYGQTFVYDEDGNVVSSKDLAETQSIFEYQDSKLVSQMNPSGSSYTYTYEDNGLLSTALTSYGVKMSFTYDSYGNNTVLKVEDADVSGSKYIETEATYSSDGNQLTKVTDALGNETSYTYNSQGLLASAEDPEGTTTTYSYDAYGYHQTGVNSGNSSVSYTYTNDYLTGITLASGQTYGFTYDGAGRQTQVKVGNQALINQTYDSRSRVTSETYGNGTTFTYTYDNANRVTQTKCGSEVLYDYDYSSYGVLGTFVHDGNRTNYLYDLSGRLVNETTTTNDGDFVSRMSYTYEDGKDRLKALRVETESNGAIEDTLYEYTYGNETNGQIPDAIYSVKVNGVEAASKTYDGLGRVVTVQTGANGPTCTFTYTDGDDANETSTQVSQVTDSLGQHAYTYDGKDNILTHSQRATSSDTWTLSYRYEYDSLNQLTRVDDAIQQKTFTYSYDTNGNILEAKTYAYTTGSLDGVTALSTDTYTYGNTNWKDQLTGYNGGTITYDGIGNPLTYYDGATFTWTEGRKLASYTKDNTSITYEYDGNGLRSEKTVNGVKTTYRYVDGMLYGEYTGSKSLTYQYDDTGKCTGFIHNDGTSSQTYYYLYNLQGDVTAIFNTSGNCVAKYIYDAWGKVVAVTDGSGNDVSVNATHIGNVNSIRYKGYYYDAVTELYYLCNRYYNSEMKRFVNADNYVSNGSGVLGCNMFAYCLNNPVIMSDKKGQSPEIIEGLKTGLAALAWMDGLGVGCDIAAFLGLVAISVYEAKKAETKRAPIKSKDVDWESGDKNHILNGTKGLHVNGWKRFGIDPKKDGSWKKILPIMKEAVDYADDVVEKVLENGDILTFFTKTFADEGVKLVVKIWTDVSGTVHRISDAIPYLID